MSIATTSLRYGWKVLAILTIGAGSIFVADNVLNRITTKDRIEITLAVVERCMALQTADGVYPVALPSIVRTWTDTNGASVIVTNSIEWRDDLSMKVSLDATMIALAPYYNDPITFEPLTATGIMASLNLGDGTNFTAIPAIGTNAATYGPWAWRNYLVAWQERYKFLNALQISSNSYMMVTGDVVFVWYEAPAPPGLTPGWDGTAYSGGGHYMGFTWSNVVADIEADFAPWPYEGSAGWGPLSTWYAQDYDYSWDDYGILSVASASKGNYKIGPYTNDRSHSVIVEARSVAYGVWSDQGAIGAEGEWVVIIDVTNSLSSWEYSAEFGGIALPEVCSYPGAKGNVNQVRYTTYYGPTPSGFYTNGTYETNTVFGSNFVFYYCTNKYW